MLAIATITTYIIFLIAPSYKICVSVFNYYMIFSIPGNSIKGLVKHHFKYLKFTKARRVHNKYRKVEQERLKMMDVIILKTFL